MMYKVIEKVIHINKNMNIFGTILSYPFSDTDKYIYKIIIHDFCANELNKLMENKVERDGYFFKISRNKFFYNWKCVFKFFYHRKKDELIFKFNKNWVYLPFQMGQLFPISQIIRDIVIYELFKKKFLFFTAAGYVNKKNKAEIYILPSFTGKTTLINKKLEEGYKILNDDWVLIDLNNLFAYPIYTISFSDNFFIRLLDNRNSSKKLKLLRVENFVTYPVEIEKIIVKNKLKTNLSFNDIIFSNSLHFLRNKIVRSLIMFDRSGDLIINNINYLLKKINNNFNS